MYWLSVHFEVAKELGRELDAKEMTEARQEALRTPEALGSVLYGEAILRRGYHAGSSFPVSPHACRIDLPFSTLASKWAAGQRLPILCKSQNSA